MVKNKTLIASETNEKLVGELEGFTLYDFQNSINFFINILCYSRFTKTPYNILRRNITVKTHSKKDISIFENCIKKNLLVGT